MHTEKNGSGNRAMPVVAVVVLTVALVASLLLLARNFMNARELQALLQQANEQGLSYQVEIHNLWTGHYSFHPAAE